MAGDSRAIDQSDRSHSSPGFAGDQAISHSFLEQHETRDSFLNHQPKYPLINWLVVWNMFFFHIYWE